MKINKYPIFAPRPWHGMTFRPWWNLLRRNQFRVRRYPMAVSASAFSAFNSAACWVQDKLYGEEIKKTDICAPLFIVGHWRTGTTLLHELLALDEQFVAPTNIQVGAAEHFLLTAAVTRLFLPSPKKRAMDNMALGWDLPQEEEFALLSMGLPTVYERVAFPNMGTVGFSALCLDELPAAEIRRWKKGYLKFLRTLQWLNPDKRLILKSPPNTARIKVLKQMFPGAQFIHITRCPKKFIPSTVHLWAALCQTNSLQRMSNKWRAEDFVFDCYHRMYAAFLPAWKELSDNERVTVRYQDLVDGVGPLGSIYEKLGIDGYQRARAIFEDELKNRDGYIPNVHQPPALLSRIEQSCSSYADAFGY